MDTFSRESIDQSADAPVADADEIEQESGEDSNETVRQRENAANVVEADTEDDSIPDFGEDEPLPDISDPDVVFDTGRLRAKMARHIERKAERAVAQLQTRTRVADKVARFAKDHPDFDEVVNKNPVLAAHQLAPDAALTVASSKHTGALLYRFGKDPALAIRVAKMSPRHQVQAVAGLIRDIEDERRQHTVRTESTQRQAPARKGPITREEQLSGQSDMTDFARQSRERRYPRRFYG